MVPRRFPRLVLALGLCVLLSAVIHVEAGCVDSNDICYRDGSCSSDDIEDTGCYSSGSSVPGSSDDLGFDCDNSGNNNDGFLNSFLDMDDLLLPGDCGGTYDRAILTLQGNNLRADDVYITFGRLIGAGTNPILEIKSGGWIRQDLTTSELDDNSSGGNFDIRCINGNNCDMLITGRWWAGGGGTGADEADITDFGSRVTIADGGWARFEGRIRATGTPFTVADGGTLLANTPTLNTGFNGINYNAGLLYLASSWEMNNDAGARWENTGDLRVTSSEDMRVRIWNQSGGSLYIDSSANFLYPWTGRSTSSNVFIADGTSSECASDCGLNAGYLWGRDATLNGDYRFNTLNSVIRPSNSAGNPTTSGTLTFASGTVSFLNNPNIELRMNAVASRQGRVNFDTVDLTSNVHVDLEFDLSDGTISGRTYDHVWTILSWNSQLGVGDFIVTSNWPAY